MIGQWVGRIDVDRDVLDELGLPVVRAARAKLVDAIPGSTDLDLTTVAFTIEGREGPTVTAKVVVQPTLQGRLRAAFGADLFRA